MKKFLRALLPLCLLLICIAAFSSCGGDTGNTTPVVTTTAPVTTTIPEGPTGVEIAFNTLTLTGTSAYGSLPNATETFSFLPEVVVAEGATYKVAADIYGRDILHSKTVPLEEGDNIFYIIVENGNDLAFYTITLRRRPIYTVTVDNADGTTPKTQKVEEGSTATIATPSRAGINFLGWNADITVPIVRDMTFIAKWDYSNLDDIYIFTYFNNGSGMSISGLTNEGEAYLQSNGGSLIIPASIDGVAITNFTRGALSCPALKSVVISNGITDIYGAFANCYNLESITIPDSVTTIGDYAFQGCTGLTSITIPDSVTTIGHYAFSDCMRLTNITIPSSVTSIGEGAFYGCTWLTSITLPFIGATKDGTTNTHFGYIFGASTYSDNASYVPASLKTVVITGGTTIREVAFYNCPSLTAITIPTSVTSIGYAAFRGCTGLTTVIFEEGSQCTSIGEYAFFNCTGLTSMTIPSSVTSIGNRAFLSCTGLTSITIPSSVTSIGYDAFCGCTGLTSITIPASVTSIDSNAFNGCTGLTSITIPSSVTSIGYDAFSGCTGLTSITIPSSVTSIGSGAFEGCTRLASITIPSSVTSIDYWAFKGCTRLTNITIPSSVTSIGEGAFKGCTCLISVTFENAEGWKADNAPLSSTALATPSVAAKYLTSWYYDETWTRE